MKFVVSAFLVLATCLLLLAASSVIALRAQVATPTFRAGTTLVEFTVVAQDSKGNAITDLTREDLVLTDKGQVRDVAFLRFDGGPAPVAGAAAVPPPAGFTTNRPDYLPAPQWSVTAIVLDLLNTALPDQMSARAQTLKYLRNLSPNTYAGLFRFSED